MKGGWNILLILLIRPRALLKLKMKRIVEVQESRGGG